jgi:hypothetical protein
MVLDVLLKEDQRLIHINLIYFYIIKNDNVFTFIQLFLNTLVTLLFN